MLTLPESASRLPAYCTSVQKQVVCRQKCFFVCCGDLFSPRLTEHFTSRLTLNLPVCDPEGIIFWLCETSLPDHDTCSGKQSSACPTLIVVSVPEATTTTKKNTGQTGWTPDLTDTDRLSDNALSLRLVFTMGCYWCEFYWLKQDFFFYVIAISDHFAPSFFSCFSV